LREIISVHKDSLPKQLHKNVVYKISYKDCDATYVGQTPRQGLKIRISERRNHINKNTKSQSIITKHRLQFKHEFDWDEVEILDSERYLEKRINFGNDVYKKIEQRSKFTIRD